MASEPDRRHRASLPIPDRPRTGPVIYDSKDPDTSFPPIEPLRPPEGAPNVVVILIDGCGFGVASAFDGHVQRRPPSGLWRAILGAFGSTRLRSVRAKLEGQPA